MDRRARHSTTDLDVTVITLPHYWPLCMNFIVPVRHVPRVKNASNPRFVYLCTATSYAIASRQQTGIKAILVARAAST